MSYVVAGRLDDLPSDIRHHLGTFRHKVFSRDLDCRTIEPAQRRACRCSLTPWRSPSRSARHA